MSNLLPENHYMGKKQSTILGAFRKMSEKKASLSEKQPALQADSSVSVWTPTTQMASSCTSASIGNKEKAIESEPINRSEREIGSESLNDYRLKHEENTQSVSSSSNVTGEEPEKSDLVKSHYSHHNDCKTTTGAYVVRNHQSDTRGENEMVSEANTSDNLDTVKTEVVSNCGDSIRENEDIGPSVNADKENEIPQSSVVTGVILRSVEIEDSFEQITSNGSHVCTSITQNVNEDATTYARSTLTKSQCNKENTVSVLVEGNRRRTRSGAVFMPNAKSSKKRRHSRRDQCYSCPVCTHDILCSDLNEFNLHVDDCLNQISATVVEPSASIDDDRSEKISVGIRLEEESNEYVENRLEEVSMKCIESSLDEESGNCVESRLEEASMKCVKRLEVESGNCVESRLEEESTKCVKRLEEEIGNCVESRLEEESMKCVESILGEESMKCAESRLEEESKFKESRLEEESGKCARNNCDTHCKCDTSAGDTDKDEQGKETTLTVGRSADTTMKFEEITDNTEIVCCQNMSHKSDSDNKNGHVLLDEEKRVSESPQDKSLGVETLCTSQYKMNNKSSSTITVGIFSDIGSGQKNVASVDDNILHNDHTSTSVYNSACLEKIEGVALDSCNNETIKLDVESVGKNYFKGANCTKCDPEIDIYCNHGEDNVTELQHETESDKESNHATHEHIIADTRPEIPVNIYPENKLNLCIDLKQDTEDMDTGRRKNMLKESEQNVEDFIYNNQNALNNNDPDIKQDWLDIGPSSSDYVSMSNQGHLLPVDPEPVDRNNDSEEPDSSGALLVCPICNLEQQCGSLADFNDHVDSCLSKGAIREILEEQRKKEGKPLKR